MLDLEQIKTIIPHREPFLLIDEILEMQPGKSAVGVKYVRADEYFFKGHFPEMPVMPGVLIMESLAQTAAVCLMSLPEFKGKIGYYAGIDGAKFKRKVLPGDTLRLEIQVTKIRLGICLCSAAAYVGEEKAAYGNLTFAIG